jgi:multidrug resistance efflux pump
VLAVVLLGFAVFQVVQGQQKPPKATPPVPPPQTPFGSSVAGAGIVEAKSENISIGSALAGVVTKVLVSHGQDVQLGEILFELDDRQLKAELEVREANLLSAQKQLARLRAMPRKEEVPAYVAKVKEAEANLADMEDQRKRTETLYDRGAAKGENLIHHRMAAALVREQLTRAKADLALLKAGAWKQDVDVQQAAVRQAKAQVEQTRIDLERLKVRAPKAGRVLQINVRPGEYAGAPPGQALVVLGNLDDYHIRVDIDEHDIPRYRAETAAYATLRGEPGKRFPLRFVRIEPYVVPKKSLTGDNTERVDTRVLQVIYAVELPPEAKKTVKRPLYVGQQVDVFIEAGRQSDGQR